MVVSWNGKELLRRCLDSLFASAGVSLDVFVVDNASKDGTPEMVRREYPQVTFIENKENFGFARANNQAIRQAHGEYILLLNQDMRLHPDTLEIMARNMRERAEVGVAGCHLVSEKGETVPHVRRFPALRDQAAILLKLPHFFPRVLDRYLMRDFNYARDFAEVDSIRGSFFFLRREVIQKIGLLDERFFFWFEEVDYCQRVRCAGFKVGYFGNAECVDYVGRSAKTLSRFKAQKIFTGSMLKYFRKWHPAWQWVILVVLRPIGLVIMWLVDAIHSKLPLTLPSPPRGEGTPIVPSSPMRGED